MRKPEGSNLDSLILVMILVLVFAIGPLRAEDKILMTKLYYIYLHSKNPEGD